ncbi:hypothetical protein ACHAPT_009865 [Fusarium lateritium]
MKRLVQDNRRWNWLEQQEAPECLDWVDKENGVTAKALDSLSRTRHVQNELRRLVEGKDQSPDFWIAGHLFRLKKNATNKQGVLEISRRSTDGSLSGWKKVISFDELGRTRGKNYFFSDLIFSGRILGPDCSRILLLLSIGGSDSSELHELDVETGELVADGFQTPECRLFTTWLDRDHILISHNLHGSPTTQSGWPANTYVWTRGAPLAEAKLVHSSPRTDSFIFLSPIGGASHGTALITRVTEDSRSFHYTVDVGGKAKQIQLPEASAMIIPSHTTSRHVVVSLTEAATVCGQKVPPGTIVAYDTKPIQGSESRTSIVYLPKDGEVNQRITVDGMAASKDRVYLTFSTRTSQRRLVLECIRNSWEFIQSVSIPAGSYSAVTGADSHSNDVVAMESGLLRPTTTWLETGNGCKTVLHSQSPAFKLDDYQAEQHSASSKDGTPIDYILLSPKHLDHTKGDNPLLMTGYGAFNISNTLDYLNASLGGVSLVPWLKSGGSLAIPYIRGGGERGPLWHQAARQEKRQNSYDDFIAVTEKLIADGFTNPKRIGVFGSSNGGLLASVMGTQRPDLFGVVVSDVPLTDMLRYPLMGMGAAWIDEYGDPKNPQMAEALCSYSPFHNIHKGTAYPAFLVTVSTRDDRVGAGHARKLVARLKEVGLPNCYLLEDREGGHGVSNVLKNTLLMSRRMAFLMEHTM